MRLSPLHTIALLVALTLTGCSASPAALIPPWLTGWRSPSPSAAATAPASGTGASRLAAPTGTPAGQLNDANDPATADIQAVIQRANQEQQDAYAKGDPTIMRDTATSAYYDQLVQISADLTGGGVSAIKLVKLEWGPVTLTSATTAEATTWETWRTTLADGSTDQSRELNVYTLVQEQGAWRIQADDHPGVGSDQPVGSGAPSGTVRPAAPTPAGQTEVSHNWSGYAATGGNFTSVAGTWTVPESSAAGGFASAATWVGIGGVESRDLIQAGTQETTNGSGSAHYRAWIEMLPRPSQPVPFPVSPGDSVTVSIVQQASGEWLIAFQNHTTGQAYQVTVQYASSLSSAEWVEEAPSVRRGIVPLDDFGVVQFSGGSAVKDGGVVTIAQAGARPITMADSNGSTIATPSALTADGQGFTVHRSAPQPAAEPYRGRDGL